MAITDGGTNNDLMKRDNVWALYGIDVHAVAPVAQTVSREMGINDPVKVLCIMEMGLKLAERPS